MHMVQTVPKILYHSSLFYTETAFVIIIEIKNNFSKIFIESKINVLALVSKHFILKIIMKE